jgi:hypothetical protein
MPGALEDGSCPETERKRSLCHLPETPFRHTRSLPGNKQNSGRGEGLIYSIPAAYFQMMQKRGDVPACEAGTKWQRYPNANLW